MRLAVVSDCHGEWESVAKRLRDIVCDGLICLGDFTQDGEKIAQALKLNFWCVCGNCDLSCQYPKEQILELEGVKIFLTHGDRYHVKNDLLNLQYHALELGCDLVLFGHNHIWCDEQGGTVRLCNPGSASRPRDFIASFGILEIENGKILSFNRMVMHS